MFNKLIPTTLAILLTFGSGANAAVLDASHTTTDNPDNNTAVGIAGTGLAQTFTILGDGTLASLSFRALKLATSVGDLTFDIRNVDGSMAPMPGSGSALFSTVIPNSDVSVIGASPYLWEVFTIDVSSANIGVSAGDKLAFVLSAPFGGNFGIQTDYTDAYSGGTRYSQNTDGDSFSPLSNADLSFSATIEPSAVPLPASLPLLFAGFGAMALIGRRKQRQAS